MGTLQRILTALAALGDVIRQLKTAIRTRRESRIKQDPPEIHVVGELQIPPAEAERRKANDQSRRHREIIGLVFAGVTMVAVIYYAGVAHKQLELTRQVLDMTERVTRAGKFLQ